jgi:hypothetical protein
MKPFIFLALAASASLGFGSIAPALADTRPAVVASGPSYSGTPDVNVAAAFYASGGGPGDFSVVRAMKSMIGEAQLQSEMTKLAGTYGQTNADLFPRVFDFTMNDAWSRAGRDNLMIPPFGSHEGAALAHDLVRDGTAPTGTFWTGYLLDHTMTPQVRAQVVADVVARYGAARAATFNRMANQFFFDVSLTLGDTISLAPSH